MECQLCRLQIHSCKLPAFLQLAAYSKDGKQYSLMEYILRETEQLHGKVRRYTSPDEHAFYPGGGIQQQQQQ